MTHHGTENEEDEVLSCIDDDDDWILYFFLLAIKREKTPLFFFGKKKELGTKNFFFFSGGELSELFLNTSPLQKKVLFRLVLFSLESSLFHKKFGCSPRRYLERC